MTISKIIAGILLGCIPASLPAQSSKQYKAVNFSSVTIEDQFWKPRIETVAKATLSACISYTENKTGRIRNFEKAALGKGKHEGIYYDDSDVYKALEAIAYALKNNPDPQLEQVAERWIDKITAAQLPDGYLNTYYTLTGIDKRWTDMSKHETYCAGHLIEAGIAYYNTTGRKGLLDAGIRFANHIDSVFRLANRSWAPGHQEIELALMRLYHQTGEANYLKLADWFLQQRGHGDVYNQNKLPLVEQRKITGHAVRAMYMYSGAADVAAVTNNTDYKLTMDSIWDDVVQHHLYITGGIGAQASNEGFGRPYDLPNASAYCETCASVGMVFWNQRMNMLTGNARYIDVLERSLYNGALDGLSLSGDRFFYGNPLASNGEAHRREWFGTACCPSNIARLVSSVGNYIYAQGEDAILVNLFIGNQAELQLKNTTVKLDLQTTYPWKGKVQLKVNPKKQAVFELRFRIPGWLSRPVPGNLYYYADTTKQYPLFLLNGAPVKYVVESGYAVIKRSWKKGDQVTMNLPMTVKLIKSNKAVRQNAGRVALQYGPLVYCVESSHDGPAPDQLIVPNNAQFAVRYQPGLLGGINTIQFMAPTIQVSPDGFKANTVVRSVQAIPYYSWNNRGSRKMRVWMAEKFSGLSLGQ